MNTGILLNILVNLLVAVISLIPVVVIGYFVVLLIRLLKAFIYKLELENARKYQDLNEEPEFKWEEPQ